MNRRSLLRASALAFSALCLTACASATTDAFAAAESTDTAALAALVTYQASGKANASVITQALAYQKIIDAALAPAEAEVKAGQAITNVDAITTAVAALTAYEAAQGITSTATK